MRGHVEYAGVGLLQGHEDAGGQAPPVDTALSTRSALRLGHQLSVSICSTLHSSSRNRQVSNPTLPSTAKPASLGFSASLAHCPSHDHHMTIT